MTRAYATLANMGERSRLTSVLHIEDGRGQVVYDVQQDRAAAPGWIRMTLYIITDILDDDEARVPAMGRNYDPRPPYPAGVKPALTTSATTGPLATRPAW